MIYLDNAATSNPKPAEVGEAMIQYLYSGNANPGRAGHSLANNAARMIFETRELISTLFNVEKSENVVFTANVSESLNLALKGILKSGDQVIVSSMEHNSMMRPLRSLEEKGIELTVISADPVSGVVNPDDFQRAIKENTKLIGINHISNVCGAIQPVHQIGVITREANILLLLDTAQSAGAIPIDMQNLNVDLLAFTGHKSLLGPMGIGGLIIGERVNLDEFVPLIEGGTGSHSEEETQPRFMPDLLEAGTPNLPGIAGLNASIKWLLEKNISVIRAKESELIAYFAEQLQKIPEIRIIGYNKESHGAVLSITINNYDIGEVGFILDRQHSIACRVGLHCSPTSHKTLGTFPDGTIRFGVSYFTTMDEITNTVNALSDIISQVK